MPEQLKSKEIEKDGPLKSVKNDFGFMDYNPLHVGTPIDFIMAAGTKYTLFDKNIKKYRHASLKEKFNYSVLKKGTSNEEVVRQNNLAIEFQKIYPYMKQGCNFFAGCSNNDEIEKYCKQIENAHKKLEKKGYVPSLKKLEANGLKFSKNKYIFKFAPPAVLQAKDINYKQQCKLLSSCVHQTFITILNGLNEVYTTKYREIEKEIHGINSELERCGYELDEAVRQYDISVYKIKRTIEEHKIYFKKGGNRRKVEKNLKTIEDNRDKLKQIVSKAKRMRLDVHFSYLQDQDAYKSLMDELQTINKWINTLDQRLKNGDISTIQTIYESFNQGIKKLESKTEKFKNSKIIGSSKLDLRVESLNEYMENIRNMILKLEKSNEEFSRAYKDYMGALERKLPIDIANIVFALLAVFLPNITPIYNLIDKVGKNNVRDDSDPFIPTI